MNDYRNFVCAPRVILGIQRLDPYYSYLDQVAKVYSIPELHREMERLRNRIKILEEEIQL